MFRVLSASLCAALIASPGQTASAADYPDPDKPIRVIIPFSPGGGTDVITRFLQPRLERALGTNLLIDNRTGAGGTIGVKLASEADPDGYTLLITSSSFTFADAVYKDQLAYNSKKDFQPITMLVDQPLVLVVHPSMPVKNVKDLIGLVLKRPREVFHANAGYGSNLHMSTELFKYMAGQQYNKGKSLPMTAVQYKGGGPSMIALISGEVQVTFTGMQSAQTFLKQGQMRAIAVSTNERSPAAPDIPTINESGVPGYVKGAWTGLYTQAAVPKGIVNTVYQKVAQVLNDPDAVEKLASDGVVPDGRPIDEFTKFVHSEIDAWKELGEKIGI
jgi:tripartite-type tricarboxylate transporter receptor subunit TctC